MRPSWVFASRFFSDWIASIHCALSPSVLHDRMYLRDAQAETAGADQGRKGEGGAEGKADHEMDGCRKKISL